MKIRFIIYISLIIFGLGSCTNEDSVIPSNRTILVYMIANNNLGSNGFATDNINDMISVASAKNLNGGKLVVYYAPVGSNPSLIQIAEGKDGVVTKHIIKDYEPQSGVDPNVMQNVIKDVVNLFPSDSYGMILWSHGTAWLPYNFSSLRSFGDDGGKQMEIDQLAKGIPDHFFEFLLFDACYMASTECVYQLRNKAEHILGSPTETMGTGFPYKQIIPYFFTKDIQLEKVAEAFYNYYNAQSGGNRTGTVSITRTSELEKLASIMQEILTDKNENDLFALPLSNMQVLERLTSKAPYMLYDLDDFVKSLATDDQYSRFRNCMEKVIICKYNTPTAFFAQPYRSFPIERFSGLSIYVPQAQFTKLTDWYKQNVEWYKAVYK